MKLETIKHYSLMIGLISYFLAILIFLIGMIIS